MPTKRAILAELTRAELRANMDYYKLAVGDRRVKAQLENALARSRKARIGEILNGLFRNRLKELCRSFGSSADAGWSPLILIDTSSWIHLLRPGGDSGVRGRVEVALKLETWIRARSQCTGRSQ